MGSKLSSRPAGVEEAPPPATSTAAREMITEITATMEELTDLLCSLEVRLTNLENQNGGGDVDA